MIKLSRVLFFVEFVIISKSSSVKLRTRAIFKNVIKDKVLDEIKDKMAKATTIQERVETQVVGMQRQSRRALALMTAALMLPGARSARGLSVKISGRIQKTDRAGVRVFKWKLCPYY